jgi:hypothetical protein
MSIRRDRPGRPLERLLIACVREHEWQRPPEEAARLLPFVDQDRLLELADRHRVSGAVWLSVGQLPGLRPEVRDRLRAAHRSTIMKQLLIEAELQAVKAALHDVPWLVVKGPALTCGYYQHPELRSYADLDVLVAPDRLTGALERLERAGYVLLDRNWTLLAQRLSGELHLLSQHGVLVDLHWDLFNDRATRDSYGMVTSTFFGRSRPLHVGDVDARTLDDLDTVVHTAVHAARSGGDRLVWMKDLEQLVLARRFTWDQLAARSAEHRAQLAVSVMLNRMRVTLDVPDVSADALRTIGGPAPWRMLGRCVDWLAPVARAGSDGSLTRMYARATRADSRATARELARRLVMRARRGAHEQDRTWDASHPESVLFDSGGRSGKEAFLAAVGSLR